MGSHNLIIKTYERFDYPLVVFKKSLLDDNRTYIPYNNDLSLPKKSEYGYYINKIDLVNIDIGEEVKSIRDLTNAIRIHLEPDWINKEKFYDRVYKIISDKEDPNEALVFSIRVICPKLNTVYYNKSVSLNEITNNKKIVFPKIELNDIQDTLLIKSELIRKTSLNQDSKLFKATQKNTILSENETIVFYIDPVENIGRNYLDIIPKDLGNKMFHINNSIIGNEPPILYYNNKLEIYFTHGDDYDTVKVILLQVFATYLEALLKWVVFGKPDFDKNEHLSIIKLICKICKVREKELEELSYLSDTDEGKIEEFMQISMSLFDNAQTYGNSWVKVFHSTIKNES